MKLIRKCLFAGFCILFAFNTVSCAGKKAQEEDNLSTFETDESAGELPGEFAKEEAARNDSNFLGWSGTTGGIIENNFETMLLKSRGDTGSFSLSALDENGKAFPVLSILQEFTNSSFYICSGKNVYKLSGGRGVKTAALKTDRGMRILYQIKDVADVDIDFQVFASVPQGAMDIIKVTAKVKNTAVKSRNMGIKVVFDTLLGEKTQYHFTDQNTDPVESEILSRDPSRFTLIESKDDKTTFQLVLKGGDATVPEFVTIGNYDTVATLDWEPNLLRQRSFNTLTSYNNTAVGVNWPCKTVLPSEELSVSFYMGASVLPSNLDVLAYAEGRPSLRKKQGYALDSASKESKTVETQLITEDPDLVQVVPSKKTTPSKSEINFDVNSITEEQLRPEYIQALIDRIQNLEESDSTMNRDDLLLLNAELDMILQRLRQ
ncbi:MAG: hypothetical protein MJ176_04050 [Treponema sp.]|nr:hypothetical protein [Treponema sp.]